MPRYKLTLEYDGGQFAGWQRQSDQMTVQQALEEALEKFCGQHCIITGAGRTDSGVHATGQVAHVDLPEEYDCYRIMQGMNFHLLRLDEGDVAKYHIAVLKAEPVSDEFHARFSATMRYYRYDITNRRSRLALDAGRAWHVWETLDLAAMQRAANHLIGHHDFTSFRDAQCQSKTAIKTLEQFELIQNGERISAHLRARSFLHHQVRIMVGTLIQVGRGRWHEDDVKTMLEAKDRGLAGLTAPPDGLYLTRVDY